MLSEQEKLIGKHPSKPHFLAIWLNGEDVAIPATDPNKKHRKLTEQRTRRSRAVKEIASLLIQHHIDDNKIAEIQSRKDEILKKYKLKTLVPYLDAQGYFPASHETKSGNLTEILLSHYLQTTSGLGLLAYKLAYNGNVEQALKGDDCLLFDKNNLSSRIIMGEAKFRAKPTPKVVKDMINNLEGSKRLPISLGFIAQHFTTKGDTIMSAKISDLLFELKGGKIPVVNVGLLLSTKSHLLSGDTILQVENNLKTSNPNLVILSLGIENPVDLINSAFKQASKDLNNRI